MKQTEIGLIPDDWEVKTIDEFATLTSGESPSKFKFIDGGIPYYKVEQMNNSLKYQKETPFHIQTLNFVQKGSVIFPKRGAAIETNKVRILSQDSFFDTNIMSVTLNETVSNEYFYYWLVKKELWQIADTTSIPQINNKHIKPLLVPIPPLPEQQRIAKALSDVDALISTTEKLLQKKKNIKQGAIQNLLTGKKRLPGFGPQTKSPAYKQTELGPIPEDWEVKSLGDIFSIKHGYGFEGQFFSSENNQHIVVTPGNFKLEGGFQKQKQPIYYTGTYPDEFKLKPNNLIIMMTDLSKNSDTLGNPAIVPDDGNYYLHNQRIGLIQIHNDSFVKDYIYLLLCTKEYHESVVATAAGSTVKHTSPNRIYSINLIVSTSKEEQTAIANVLSSMDKEIETLNTKLEKYRNLKTAMMQQLLTGKIRLK